MKTLTPSQQACLDAMGIDVWVQREPTESVIEIKNFNQEDAPVIPSKDDTIEPKGVVEEPSDVKDSSSTAINIPQDWNGLMQAVSVCQACSLHTSRTQTVFGEGNQQADWLVIGDVPSSEEDQKGFPFRGPQGELLTAMLRAIGLSRQQVYLTNIIKCKTPNNRDAESMETDSCIEYLKQQVRLIQPKIILVVGQNAAQQLLNNHSTLARLRQKVHNLEDFNIPVVVTYHPASLLSMPANKRDAWHDLLFAQKTISAEDVL